MDADVDLECDIAQRDINLRDIVELRPGDVIPITLPEEHVLTANGIPMFKVNLGQCGEHLALKVSEQIVRPNMGASIPMGDEDE